MKSTSRYRSIFDRDRLRRSCFPAAARKRRPERGTADGEAAHEAEVAAGDHPDSRRHGRSRHPDHAGGDARLQAADHGPGRARVQRPPPGHLTARTPGRVERVLAVAGDRVRQGQVLAEIYSPDFMSLQAEYLQAAERAERFASDPSEAGTARAILESARERFILVGATRADVDALRPSASPGRFCPSAPPSPARSLKPAVVAGDHVELGASLFRLADLSILWAHLHIKEKDLAAIQTGSAGGNPHPGLPRRDFSRGAAPGRRRSRREHAHGHRPGRGPEPRWEAEDRDVYRGVSGRRRDGPPWSCPSPRFRTMRAGDRLRRDGERDVFAATKSRSASACEGW